MRYSALPQVRKSIVDTAKAVLRAKSGKCAREVRRWRPAGQYAAQGGAEFAHADTLGLGKGAQGRRERFVRPIGLARQVIAQT